MKSYDTENSIMEKYDTSEELGGGKIRVKKGELIFLTKIPLKITYLKTWENKI